MTGPRSAALIGGIGLLERAIAYALSGLPGIGPDHLACPTPCAGWDLRALLEHLNDSLLALYDAARIGQVDLAVSDVDGDPVALLRERANRLLGAWAGASPQGPVFVAGSPLTAGIVTATGALEIAVHGWDIARACGRDHPIPSGLAEELLALAPFFVTDDDRPARFAPAVVLPPGPTTSDCLLAFLGRCPEGRTDRRLNC